MCVDTVVQAKLPFHLHPTVLLRATAGVSARGCPSRLQTRIARHLQRILQMLRTLVVGLCCLAVAAERPPKGDPRECEGVCAPPKIRQRGIGAADLSSATLSSLGSQALALLARLSGQRTLNTKGIGWSACSSVVCLIRCSQSAFRSLARSMPRSPLSSGRMLLRWRR